MISEFDFQRGLTELAELTTESPSNIWNVFGESKIGDLDVPISSKEDVFGFEIAVDNIERVKVIEGEGDFGSEEFGDRIREALYDKGMLSQTRQVLRIRLDVPDSS